MIADRSTFIDPPFACPPPSDDEIIAAYAELGSVWKVGHRLNVTGQAIHYRLHKLGVDTSVPPEFTDAQKQRIREYYETEPAETFSLYALSAELQKPRSKIGRFAKREGLTDRKRQSNDATKLKARRPKWQDKPHPRGMKGKTHSAETRAKFSEISKRKWATWKTFGIGPMSPEGRARNSRQLSAMHAARPASTYYTRTKGGHRADLNGIYFRSSWEANYARYLNLLIKFGVVEKWDFEPETFWFEGIARGAVSYKPDFRVKYKNDPVLEYVEIKGWIVPKDRTKWKRMKKYHPHIKLVVVGAKQYYAIQKKWASTIPNWETKDSPRPPAKSEAA